MSDRLSELQRQRALAQEQVAWFDREIARESGGAVKPTGPAPAPTTATSVPGAIPSAPVPDPDELVRQYQSRDRSIHSEVKRGCLLYFFAAFALLTLGVAAFYFFWKR